MALKVPGSVYDENGVSLESEVWSSELELYHNRIF